MASETQNTPDNSDDKRQQTIIGLAMLAGAGVTIIMLALTVGVIIPNVDSGLIGLSLLVGFGLLVMGVGGWVGVVQPHKNFDDITQPQYHGHHDDDHDEANP